jgi:hypothetical protein
MVPSAKQLARTAVAVAASTGADLATAERAVRAMAHGHLTFPRHSDAVTWSEDYVNEVSGS